MFIALAIYTSVWYNYEKTDISTRFLGFGFLIVAIFDGLHTLYYLKLNLSINSYYDLSTWNWILGRLTQAVMIYLSTFNLKVKINKWIPLVGSIAFVMGIFYFINIYHHLLPMLLTDKGVTPLKITLEYIAIAIFAISLYKIKSKGFNSNKNCYIFTALLLIILSELSFTLYGSVQSIAWTTGHALKITSYYFLFRGIFVTIITDPYRRLEEEHRQLEEAHEELNSMSRTLGDILDALPVAVLKYNKKAEVKYVNKKFEELFECHRNELCGIKEEEFLQEHKRLKITEESLFNNVMDSENGQVNILRSLNTKSGQHIKLSVSANRITNGALILVKDAREEQMLKNLHLQTETILNAVTNGILMIDNNKKIVLCNKALEELYEMDKSEIIGRDIDELNSLTRFEKMDLPMRALSGSSDKEAEEATITTLGGSVKKLLLYIGTIRNIDGEVIGAISVSTDITKLKEEQLKIQQQEKLALLGQLGAGIVHETRNYLTTIKGRCQLIGITSKDEETRKYAEKINKDVDEVNRIISEFLFLSKPRELELQEVSVYDIFHSIKNIVETSSLVKGIDVDMEISQEERYLFCDEVQIKQVILNMCKNAVEAMSDIVNPRLKVETGYDEASNKAFIKISDNGKGMCEEELKNIGTLFFTTKKTGTGLGLNVCYQIIKDHNGSVEVQSQVGKGTTFTITLPCIEDEEEEYEEVS
jgi:PAS domain S-box-containing protein